MKRSLLYSGVLLLSLFVCLVGSMMSVPTLLVAYTTPPLAGEMARWVVWGAWGWVALSLFLTLAKGCPLTARPIRIAVFHIPPHWLLPLSTWGIGVLVALLTGNLAAGAGLAWSGVLWLALLVGQSLRCKAT